MGLMIDLLDINKELRADNRRLKEELNTAKTAIAHLEDSLALAKSRQLGKYQVAVDVPEPDKLNGTCNLSCPVLHGDERGCAFDWDAWAWMKNHNVGKPGPGCPRWEGESDG